MSSFIIDDMHFQGISFEGGYGTFNDCVVCWCWAGTGRSFCELLCDTRFTLVVDGGASVISSARCLVSSLDNRPLSCNMLQLTSAVSPAIQRIFTPGYLSLSKLAIANRGKCGQ